MSDDGERLYIPIEGGCLLKIEADDMEVVSNGSNQDDLWIEHPNLDPLRYSEDVDVYLGLADFERLVVDTQACSDPAMRWFVAMHAALFPFIRDLCPARMIQQSIGGSQCGTTSGAARFNHRRADPVARLLNLCLDHGPAQPFTSHALLNLHEAPGVQVW